MLALSHTTGYAVLALGCLAYSGDRWVLAKDIAACADVPQHYLSKILHALAQGSLIKAKRGYRGGFRLARPPGSITLADVVRAVEGSGWDQRCLLGLEGCSPERDCPTHRFWSVERDRIRAELERITLEEVASFEHAEGKRLSCCTGAAVAAAERDADVSLRPAAPAVE